MYATCIFQLPPAPYRQELQTRLYQGQLRTDHNYLNLKNYSGIFLNYNETIHKHSFNKSTHEYFVLTDIHCTLLLFFNLILASIQSVKDNLETCDEAVRKWKRLCMRNLFQCPPQNLNKYHLTLQSPT